MYHYDAKIALEELQEDALLPHPVKLRDMILRTKLGPQDAQLLNHDFQVVLKIVIQELRVLRAQLRPENHVTQFYRMRKKGIFLQFLERNLGIVVIHGFPPAEKRLYSIVLSCRFEGGFAQRVKEEVLRGGCRNRHELVARDFRS